ncbi:MAG: FkbM family methyltransferase [Desulfobacteraceae bacterium]|nr:MAG: FkbM family methyltransferase [Desulfobacteraceae bacterium]
MRIEDIHNFFTLRQITSNPLEIIRFRKNRNIENLLKVQFLNGPPVYLRGGSRDFHLFHRIYLRDEYRLNSILSHRLGCVLDLGANIGLFATRVAPFVTYVIAYEPVPVNYIQLKKNTKNFLNITAVQSAVSHTEGTLRIFIPINKKSTGSFSAFFNKGKLLENDYIEVQSLLLDTIFKRHEINECDLLKIDVEGAEYEIFYAASDDTFARIKRIHGEYHDVRPAEVQSPIMELKGFLENKGFTVQIEPHHKNPNNGLFFARRTIN